MDWTVLDQAVILCQAFVNTVMDIRIHTSREVAWWIKMNSRRNACAMNFIWLLFAFT
jgi:hypothetical protein